jgi:hypothetical protein
LILNVVLVGALMVSHESHKIEVPPNHAMEDAIGCMKGQGGSVRSMDALTLMQLNGCFANIWTINTML